MGKSVVVYNELIAEFMQYERNRLKYYIPDMAGMCSDGVYTNKFDSEELKFHSSWDWLMKVVEKIETILPENHILSIETDRCKIVDIESYHLLSEIVSEDKLGNCFKIVIQFIEEYNKKQWEDEHK